MNNDFSIEALHIAEKSFYEILESARDGQWEDAVYAAMERALKIIRKDAWHAGEPLYDLKKIKMQICRIVSQPLYVEYGVHISKQQAVIRRVVLLRKPD